MSHLQPTLVSEAEFLALPETMDRVELLDGEVVVSPAPTFGHQLTLRRLVTALDNWARGQAEPVTIGMAPLDVRFAPGRILQPDAFVVFGHIPREHRGPLDVVPPLCVEVVSNDRVYDRVTKRGIYATAGVRELWTIIPEGVGLFERWTGANLMTREEIRGTIASPLLPGFTLDLAELFAD
jgi:Uma2 family endonuclease